MRYLGVDPGGRRMGLAVGDDGTGVASPLAVEPYEGVEPAAAMLDARAREVGAEVVVIGLPTAEDGSETQACRRSHALAEALATAGIRVELQPEFLTTDEARRRARLAGRSPREPVDHLAAQVMLEEFLAGLDPAPEDR